jgi:hypothetical protein
MLNKKYVLLAALFVTSLTHPAYAADTNGATDDTPQQQNKNSDFDNWYKPDDAYQSNDQNQQPATNTVSPNGGEEEPRVAPLEDTRPKER